MDYGYTDNTFDSHFALFVQEKETCNLQCELCIWDAEVKPCINKLKSGDSHLYEGVYTCICT